MSTVITMPARSGGRLLSSALAAAVLTAGVATGSAAARPAPESFADLVEDVGPAVVQITTEGVAARPNMTPDAVPEHFREGPFKEFYERFFGEKAPSMQPPSQPRSQPRAAGLGSGFLIDDDGLVVTNNHVIKGASKITVTLRDGRKLDAEVVGRDPKTDLAVLRVEPDAPIPALEWGDSDEIRVGDWVVAMGNPFGLSGTVTAGIVSARGRDIGAGPYDDFIQIDASINRGNSGGPLFDQSGNVVGVNTAIFSPSGGNVGIGFAIPAAVARDIVADLVDDGTVDRGWLGVMIQSVTPDIAESLGLDGPEGAMISRVEPSSPAAAAGLRVGDVVTGFDGDAVDGVRDLTRAAAAADVGSVVPVTVWRDSQETKIDLEVGSAPVTVADATPTDGPTLNLNEMGIAVASLNSETRAQFDVSDEVAGVVIVDVDQSGEAARKGVRPGDVITQADGNAISSPDDLRKVVEEVRSNDQKRLLVLIKRDNASRFVALTVSNA